MELLHRSQGLNGSRVLPGQDGRFFTPETIYLASRAVGDTDVLLPVVEQVPQLEQPDTGLGSMYARFEELGYQLRMEETVSIRMPLPEELGCFTSVPEFRCFSSPGSYATGRTSRLKSVTCDSRATATN
jgi:hypothetical protein